MLRLTTTLLLVCISGYGIAGQPTPAAPDDIQDYSTERGIGCMSKSPITKQAEFYFVCRSRRSTEHAWSAALYRGKLACNGRNFSVFFNMPASLPNENEIYAAQVELKCTTTP